MDVSISAPFSLNFDIQQETPDDFQAVEALQSECFGPGRFSRSAFRLRNGYEQINELAFIAHFQGDLIGSIRFSHLRAADHFGLMLGPLAVAPAFKSMGVGVALMRHALNKAKELNYPFVILIGDLPYYARVGFQTTPKNKLKMPYTYDPARLLFLLLKPEFNSIWEGFHHKEMRIVPPK